MKELSLSLCWKDPVRSKTPPNNCFVCISICNDVHFIIYLYLFRNTILMENFAPPLFFKSNLFLSKIYTNAAKNLLSVTRSQKLIPYHFNYLIPKNLHQRMRQTKHKQNVKAFTFQN